MSTVYITKKQFQIEADIIKRENSIKRFQAYELLAKQYGYKTYNDIKKTFVNENENVEVLSYDDFKQMEMQRILDHSFSMNTYFKEEYRFENQQLINDVAYNPVLDDDFWNNPNEDRDREEIDNWWGRAFIVSHFYRSHANFTVYCLDGGAWDRPTNLARFEKFEDALSFTQEHNKLSITHNIYDTLSNGSVVNASGLFITTDGNRTNANIVTNIINYKNVENAKLFISKYLIKSKKISYKSGTTYQIKELVEYYLKLNHKDKDSYINHGEFIKALDECGFHFKENIINGKYSQNLYINIKKIDNNLRKIIYSDSNKGDEDWV